MAADGSSRRNRLIVGLVVTLAICVAVFIYFGWIFTLIIGGALLVAVSWDYRHPNSGRTARPPGG
jgi:hypothetical protein